MGHTKKNPWADKRDRHEQRGDVANVRGDIKKHGAGAGNWGQIGDEVLEDRQVTIFDLRKEVILEDGHVNDKLKMLDDKQFTHLRRWSQ
ncbi:unnamed protein product [Umbelopsis vinacea]